MCLNAPRPALHWVQPPVELVRYSLNGPPEEEPLPGQWGGEGDQVALEPGLTGWPDLDLGVGERTTQGRASLSRSLNSCTLLSAPGHPGGWGRTCPCPACRGASHGAAPPTSPAPRGPLQGRGKVGHVWVIGMALVMCLSLPGNSGLGWPGLKRATSAAQSLLLICPRGFGPCHAPAHDGGR